MINIQELNKADILRVLYNAALAQNMGMLAFIPGDMSKEEAEKLMKRNPPYFDYINGRIMKIKISGTHIDERLYDRDNGPGAAARAINTLSEN